MGVHTRRRLGSGNVYILSLTFVSNFASMRLLGLMKLEPTYSAPLHINLPDIPIIPTEQESLQHGLQGLLPRAAISLVSGGYTPQPRIPGPVPHTHK
jgi:hypothetical protein